MHRCLISRNQRPEHVARVYALGMFDGVHIGHMALIQTAVKTARERGDKCGVYTFDVHPARVVHADRAHYALMSLDDRLDLIESAGVDVAVVHAFDTELASMSPEAFVSRVLRGALDARRVVVGFDYSFGHGGAGGPTTLESLAHDAGICVDTLPPVQIDGAPVSSTRVRAALSSGEVERAALLLGRRHFVRGTVERGRGVGTRLGIPTANVSVPTGIALPMPGVYACEARWGSLASAPAVCNIGMRPTFDDQGRGVTLEVHVMGARPDLYGAVLTVEFAARLRDELRFADTSELVRQIEADMIAARRLLGC